MEKVYKYKVEEYADGNLIKSYVQKSSLPPPNFAIFLFEDKISNSPYIHVRRGTLPHMSERYYIEIIDKLFEIHLDKEESIRVEEVVDDLGTSPDHFFLLSRNDKPMFPSLSSKSIIRYLEDLLEYGIIHYIRKGKFCMINVETAVQNMIEGEVYWCVNEELQKEGEEVMRLSITFIPK